ncbi:hypothetical protein Egran_00893, partial [Elaphomyces granulatus]
SFLATLFQGFSLHLQITDAERSCSYLDVIIRNFSGDSFLVIHSSSLLKLGRTCKALYAFTRSEDLWKTLFIRSPPATFSWLGTWRSTYLNLSPSQVCHLDCSCLFSDTLHRPFYCAHIALDSFVSDVPARNQITRFPTLSAEEFQQRWADRPFILTEPVKEWPVYPQWSMETLLSTYGDTIFRAEAVDWPLKTYVDYMKNNSDESPLYLFDRSFVSKMGITRPNAEFWRPPCFGDDLFAQLGPDRPDSQWLIIGPERSGSTFHKDPNATSAWNAVLRGSKYWIMFPSSSNSPPPPGVYVSADQSEVTSPLSIAEWFLGFHAEARRAPGCIEGICKRGEILHVPSGWWHLVVNLKPTIAITQNFIPRPHLTAALDFLQNKADQVSGFREDVVDPYARFVERLRDTYPKLLEKAIKELERQKKGTKRKWDELIHGRIEADHEIFEDGACFSFGFADDGSDIEVT